MEKKWKRIGLKIVTVLLLLCSLVSVWVTYESQGITKIRITKNLVFASRFKKTLFSAYNESKR